jgi:hypothetical protein
MKRIAILALISAAAAFGVTRSTLAETTIPLEDLTLVSETTAAETPLADGTQPVQYRPFQHPRPHFPQPTFTSPHFPRPHFASPHFPRPHFASPHFPRPHFPRPHFPQPHFPRPRGF